MWGNVVFCGVLPFRSPLNVMYLAVQRGQICASRGFFKVLLNVAICCGLMWRPRTQQMKTPAW
jgi:hypothetical protein